MNVQAILLMAYGSPDSVADLPAYYADIRHGRKSDPRVLEELQRRYEIIGGKTPLLEITQQQARLLEQRLGIKTYVGMKHWRPNIASAVEEIEQSGASEIVAMAMAPHYSTMSIAEYREHLQTAVNKADEGMSVKMIERWGNNAVFIDSICERMKEALARYPSPSWDEVEVLFTAHSLPSRILAHGDLYPYELMNTCRLVARQLQLPNWRLVYQSAGKTTDEWLGPDVVQVMQMLAKEGARQVLVAPIGFTTDNLEILFDIDVQAAEAASACGLVFYRIATANTTPRFIDALEQVVASKLSTATR